jgi:hypothetical protein
VEHIIEQVQTLISIQRFSSNAELLEVIQDVSFNALQTWLCQLCGVRFNTKGEIFGFYQTVVPLGLLILKHLGVLTPNVVKIIALWRDGNILAEALLGGRRVKAGNLTPDGRSK